MPSTLESLLPTWEVTVPGGSRPLQGARLLAEPTGPQSSNQKERLRQRPVHSEAATGVLVLIPSQLSRGNSSGKIIFYFRCPRPAMALNAAVNPVR